MKKIEMEIECPACSGTGLYQGIGEGKQVAVICNKCKGTGSFLYVFSYNIFTKRKIKKGIERVYLNSMGYKINLGKIKFENGIGEIDMNKEGISYLEFLNGKMPKPIKKLGCPMLHDQSACHSIKGFVDVCNKLNGGWLSYIPNCKNKENKNKCWGRFEEGGIK